MKERINFNDEAEMLFGWQSIDNATYYFAKDGKLVNGEQTIDGENYYFQKDGKLLTGWNDGVLYDDFGYKTTGEYVEIDTDTYVYLDENGNKVTWMEKRSTEESITSMKTASWQPAKQSSGMRYTTSTSTEFCIPDGTMMNRATHTTATNTEKFLKTRKRNRRCRVRIQRRRCCKRSQECIGQQHLRSRTGTGRYDSGLHDAGNKCSCR